MTEPTNDFPFRIRQDFLSPTEVNFFNILSGLTRDKLYIVPKVSLSDLFFVVRPNENVQQSTKLLRKNVDFLLLWRDNMRPALAIELDYPKQALHRSTDTFLDNLFENSGIPLVHVLVRSTYELQPLAKQLRDALKKSAEISPDRTDYSPLCPRCGITMVLRFDKNGPLEGGKYYGCLNYPTCQEIIPVK